MLHTYLPQVHIPLHVHIRIQELNSTNTLGFSGNHAISSYSSANFEVLQRECTGSQLNYHEKVRCEEIKHTHPYSREDGRGKRMPLHLGGNRLMSPAWQISV